MGEFTKYYPELEIKNIGVLRPGKGAKYLECIKDHKGGIIAKQWRNKIPSNYEVLIDFTRSI